MFHLSKFKILQRYLVISQNKQGYLVPKEYCQLFPKIAKIGGTSKTLCNLSHPPIKDMQIVENLCDIVKTGVAGVKVVDWLERREKGEEERDMVTDLDVARGWEVDAAIVIVSKENKTWENAVMRVVSHVIVIRNF